MRKCGDFATAIENTSGRFGAPKHPSFTSQRKPEVRTPIYHHHSSKSYQPRRLHSLQLVSVLPVLQSLGPIHDQVRHVRCERLLVASFPRSGNATMLLRPGVRVEQRNIANFILARLAPDSRRKSMNYIGDFLEAMNKVICFGPTGGLCSFDGQPDLVLASNIIKREQIKRDQME